MDTSILVAGDTCPIGRNAPIFRKGNGALLLNDLLPYFDRADLVTVNLECPLIRQESPIEKNGPRIGAPLECVNGLKAMHVDVANLANNHIADHGPLGLRTTIHALTESGIGVVGAGENLVEARRVFTQEINGLRIGILALAEHEFSIAGKDTPGANPLDMIEYIRQMRDLKRHIDYMIVLLHGGNEYYPYPSPALQNRCRFMVEEGAHAVICQHSHCPGCYEEYNGGYIVYGQGNLLFDRHPRKQGEWNRGFLVRFSIAADKTITTDLIPYIQSEDEPGAKRMSTKQEAAFRQELAARSANVTQEGSVEHNWRHFCRSKRYLYFSILRGHNKAFRWLNRMTHFTDWFYSRRQWLALQNIIRCEAHREIIQSIVSDI